MSTSTPTLTLVPGTARPLAADSPLRSAPYVEQVPPVLLAAATAGRWFVVGDAGRPRRAA